MILLTSFKIIELKLKRLLKIIVIFLSLIGFAAVIRRCLLLNHIIAPTNLSKYPNFDSGFSIHPALTFAHIIPGALFMITGPLLFLTNNQKHEKLNKGIEFIYFLVSYIIGVTALLMSYTTSIGGANETAATTLFAVFFLFCLSKALFYWKSKIDNLKKEWLLRSLSIGLAISTTRIIVGAFFALSHLSPHEFFGIAFWIGFTLHLIVVEAWIRNTKPQLSRDGN